MATSGQVNSGTAGSGGRTYFYVKWLRTDIWNSDTCGSVLKWELWLHNGNWWYVNALRCNDIYINDEKVSSGGTWSNYTDSGDFKLLEGTTNVQHENDGTKTFNIYFTCWFYNYGDKVGSDNFTLEPIPRQTSITNFTVLKRTETSFTVNWETADIIDYLWYSSDNGSSWTGLDVTDGTSGNFIVSGLSPNTTYNCKIRVRRKTGQQTTDSTTVSQTTYKAPTQSLSSKTETSITMNWSCDTTANYIWYSIDDGNNWIEVGSVNATSGSYTIDGLNANTSYNIKTRVRRSATNTTYDTTVSTQTTYDYPYVSAVETNNLVIGNQQKLTLYNPLNRNVTVKMYQNNMSGTELYSDTCNSTSKTFTPTENTLYSSIPNTQTGNCVYSIIYGSSTKTTQVYTYSVQGTETPTFNDFTYKDSNINVTNVTGNDQIMVKGLSTVQVTVSSANKMVAKNSAIGKNYSIVMDSLSDTVNYSENEIIKEIGTILSSGTQRLNVTAYDSRNLYTTIYKDITVYDYVKPVIYTEISRRNQFENETTLKVNGTYTKLTINETDKNTITRVQYRYREIDTDTWSDWTNITTTVNNGNFTCSDVVISLNNSKAFEFEIRALDSLQQTTVASANVDVGQAIFFISCNDKPSYLNTDLEINGDLNVAEKIYSNNKEVATKDDINDKAPINSPAFTGTPQAPTPTSGDNSNKIATTQFVQNTMTGLAPLNSPQFAGTPTTPDVNVNTNNTQIANTQFVKKNIAKAFYVAGFVGVLVKFKDAGLLRMITVRITGNSYGANKPIDSVVQGYHFNSVGYFINCSQYNTGGDLPQCKFMIYDGKICLWIPTPGIYTSLIIEAWSTNIDNDIYDFELQGFDNIPSGSNQTVCNIWSNTPITLNLANYLLNNWSTNGANYFYKHSNIVTLSMSVRDGNAQTIAILPDGYKPSQTLIIPATTVEGNGSYLLLYDSGSLVCPSNLVGKGVLCSTSFLV